MADDKDRTIPHDPSAFVTEVDSIVPAHSTLDAEPTTRDLLGQTPLDPMDPLDPMENTPKDPVEAIRMEDLETGVISDSEPTGPELLDETAPDDRNATGDPDSTDPGALEQTPPENPVRLHPKLFPGDPTVLDPTRAEQEAPMMVDASPTIPDPGPPAAVREAASRPAKAETAAPAVRGGESRMDTPLPLHVEQGASRLASDPALERTEIVGQSAHPLLEPTVPAAPPIQSVGSGAAGWAVAVAVIALGIVVLFGVYWLVLRPQQEELEALRSEISKAQAREFEVRSELETLTQSKSQLEAATEVLNRQVEEQEGERDAASREEEAADAERRREDEGKAGKKGKKKRKKKRR